MIEPMKPPRSLLSAAGKAIADYDMIRDGDRILLGLSGGKDSLSLLHVLLDLQKKAPIKFTLGVCTIDPQSTAYDPSPLMEYVPQLGVPHFLERFPIMEQAKKSMTKDSYCAFCSRMRRGMLYGCARREGYNVLALAQHLDDVAETFLMSAFFGGKLRTMKAHYVNDAGDIRIIRPLMYARERQTAAFAKNAPLPVIPENCPSCFGMPTERMNMKTLLAQLERDNSAVLSNMLTAMRPLMGERVVKQRGLKSKNLITTEITESAE